MSEVQSVATVLQHRCFQEKKSIDSNVADVLVKLFLAKRGQDGVGFSSAQSEGLLDEILDYLSNPLELASTVPVLKARCLAGSLLLSLRQEDEAVRARLHSSLESGYRGILSHSTNDAVFRELLSLLAANLFPLATSPAPSRLPPLVPATGPVSASGSQPVTRLKSALTSILPIGECSVFRTLLASASSPLSQLYDVLCVCWGVFVASLPVTEAEDAVDRLMSEYMQLRKELIDLCNTFMGKNLIEASYVMDPCPSLFELILRPIIENVPIYPQPELRSILAKLKTALGTVPANSSVPRSTVLPIFLAAGREWMRCLVGSKEEGDKSPANDEKEKEKPGLIVSTWWEKMALESFKTIFVNTSMGMMNKGRAGNSNNPPEDMASDLDLELGKEGGISNILDLDDSSIILTTAQFDINIKPTNTSQGKKLSEREIVRFVPVIGERLFDHCQKESTCEHSPKVLMIKGSGTNEGSFVRLCCPKCESLYTGITSPKTKSLIAQIIVLIEACLKSKTNQHLFLFGLTDLAEILMQDNVQSLLKDHIGKKGLNDENSPELMKYTNKKFLQNCVDITSHPTLRQFRYKYKLEKFLDENDTYITTKAYYKNIMERNPQSYKHSDGQNTFVDQKDEGTMTPDIFPSPQLQSGSPIIASSSEWEMRRQLVHLHKIMSMSTHSTQTYDTHFKTTGESQTVTSKDAQTGTYDDSSTEAIKHMRVLNGLVGEPTKLIESRYDYDPN